MIITQKHIRTNEELFIEAYRNAFPKVASFVKKMGGDFEEAKDIFQDALVIYYEQKVATGQAAEDESLYITGISRHLWYKKFREKKTHRSLNILPDLKQTDKEPQISENLLRFVEISGKKCLELLKSFYYDKMNMKALSEKFGFSGERSATTQKYKCLEKVRNSLKERSLNKEDFYE